MTLKSLARRLASPLVPIAAIAGKARVSRMKETVIESPLIGSGSQEEAERRVNTLLDMGTSRGYLTYEELNTKLPDEVVSPDKLDTLLMMIDEMGIKLIDEHDIGEFTAKPRGASQVAEARRWPRRHRQRQATPCRRRRTAIDEDEDEEEIDLNLEEELAEASTKRIDDPVRMYLTQMGEIPLLTREQEIAPGQEDRNHPQDFPLARCSNAITAFSARSRFFSRSTTAICRSTAR